MLRKNLLILSLLLVSSFGYAATEKQVVEVQVSGLKCAFCASGLEKSLKKLPDVTEVKVSLKESKIRLVMQSEKKLNIDQIKKSIFAKGFTPGSVKMLTQK